ncbi:MAG: bifunctional [glutamine synthetase] adenylyltransferase/[glutamine synthetase]-adenylyl-L-tyrosine phosphorylase [Corynebacterium sp.]|nr:bifunctional [glutamine synthetase] adenylyltransferase/[glutamine synthetase]-adenylyl-L-tyrosine phosphorylase [Corynebacterium sp.]
MTAPRTSRRELPTPPALGLSRINAKAELEELGWYDLDHVQFLWAISNTASPDQALTALLRLHDLAEESEWNDLVTQLADSVELRARVIGLLGGSTVLGDHLISHPYLWREIVKPIPAPEEMMAYMLHAVDAVPDGEETTPEHGPYNVAADRLTQAGNYRAFLPRREAEKTLRTAYRTLLMRIAAADLAGTFLFHSGEDDPLPSVPYVTVTHLLTALADAGLTATLACARGEVWKEGVEPTAQVAVIAMGKCGARELNYISDVDVIFVAEPAGEEATKVAAEFNRIGSSALFEVDAALRPEGKSGALVRTLESHLTYYTKWAETWEFQAQLKARPMTGEMALGRAYWEALRPLVWSASQRESFVSDVQAMRRRVLENVPRHLTERELKLGEGGLRDVEFAVQLLQMVHGRVDESLRVTSTVEALQALIDGGYIGREDGSQLVECYEFLRLLEHRLQLQRLRRTHTMPEAGDTDALRFLSRAAGIVGTTSKTSETVLADRYRQTRLIISSLHTKLFYRPLLNSVVGLDSGTIKLSPEAAKLQLAALNYRYPDRAYEHLRALASSTSRRGKIQAMLLPTLMGWLGHTAEPDAGLLAYRKLSEAARDEDWYLRLLRDEGVVGQRLMHILGTSPYVRELVLARPAVVKLLGDDAHGPKLMSTSTDKVRTALVAAASRRRDPDEAIAVARSLRRMELARIGAADLLGFMDVPEVCRALSTVWDAVLDAALASEMSAAGEPAAKIAVIGMGRLGGHELGYGSDADVLFVCDPLPGVADHEAIAWATGVCDRMRRRLAKPSADPPLEVDVGLRPEGRSGPVVRTLDSYRTYYTEWAEVWEVQALLRATFIAGDRDTGVAFLHSIDPVRYPEGGIDDSVVREVRRMKARVDTERLPRGADKTMHTKLGRGGLADVEWTVQLLTLMHAHEYPDLHNTSTLECLEVIKREGIIPPDDADKLRDGWLTATQARNALVLVKGKRVDSLPVPGPQLAHVAGAAGWDPNNSQEFLEDYLKTTRRARQVVDEVFWGEDTSFEP